MKNTNLNFKKFFAAGLAVSTLFFTACNEDDNDDMESSGQSNAKISMTDAPVDNKEVEAVFITVTDVKIDGQSYDGFSGRKTFNIMAMHEGRTETLFDGDLENKTYQKIEIEIDLETDADGNSPGSYIETTNGTKKRIMSSASSTQSSIMLVIEENTEVEDNEQNEFVIDLDLRKSIRQNTNGDYMFASQSQLNNSVRIVEKEESNKIVGALDPSSYDDDNYDEIVAYLYAKGDYDSTREYSADGSDDVYFNGAVTSTTIAKSNGSYQFNYLEDGDYELKFVGYKDTDADGKLEINASLNVSSSNNIDLNGINLNGGSTTQVDASVTSFLGL